jgi:hypothetical protein
MLPARRQYIIMAIVLRGVTDATSERHFVQIAPAAASASLVRQRAASVSAQAVMPLSVLFSAASVPVRQLGCVISASLGALSQAGRLCVRAASQVSLVQAISVH